MRAQSQPLCDCRPKGSPKSVAEPYSESPWPLTPHPADLRRQKGPDLPGSSTAPRRIRTSILWLRRLVPPTEGWPPHDSEPRRSPSSDLHVKPYANRHVKANADSSCLRRTSDRGPPPWPARRGRGPAGWPAPAPPRCRGPQQCRPRTPCTGRPPPRPGSNIIGQPHAALSTLTDLPHTVTASVRMHPCSTEVMTPQEVRPVMRCHPLHGS
jgi:hypothetical protein